MFIHDANECCVIREHLWKLFYPADYQPMVPTPEAQPGEKRQHKTLELKLTINANSTIDILFTKNLVGWLVG